eukprot:scaffold349772_cov35-Attheya_sp.AAC.3
MEEDDVPSKHYLQLPVNKLQPPFKKHCAVASSVASNTVATTPKGHSFPCRVEKNVLKLVASTIPEYCKYCKESPCLRGVHRGAILEYAANKNVGFQDEVCKSNFNSRKILYTKFNMLAGIQPLNTPVPYCVNDFISRTWPSKVYHDETTYPEFLAHGKRTKPTI